MAALDNLQRKMKIVSILAETKKPLPTTFRVAYSVSLPVELADLLGTLKRDHKINVSRELEGPIKARALAIARQINKQLGLGEEKTSGHGH